MADTIGRRTQSSLKSKKLWLILIWVGGLLLLLAIFLFGWLPVQEARQQLTALEDVEMLEKRLASISSQPDPIQTTAADWLRWHRAVPGQHDESAWLQQVRELSRRTGINVKKLRFVERQLLLAPSEQKLEETDANAAGAPSDAENELVDEGAPPSVEKRAQLANEGTPAIEQWTYELEGAADYESWLSWLSDIQRQERLHRLEKWTMQHSYSIDMAATDSHSKELYNVQLIIHVYTSPGTDALATS
ncbi:hypothetical protein M3650_01700 [Paenibacillus sp. MER TA 81-3]|uniref:hypothetical protein n=1 Tax=Paenibacillus sp. MER TA 81-3 TaxID=2939573 RepID=UPI00203E1517|nr:hypothetical protein [Paenibacillus sp. MER TA 81-3]MCM3337397.1 hypothetical protein [Paenibacillus sp. MER TA 81-3]